MLREVCVLSLLVADKRGSLLALPQGCVVLCLEWEWSVVPVGRMALA